jgi:hypothetical protein
MEVSTLSLGLGRIQDSGFLTLLWLICFVPQGSHLNSESEFSQTSQYCFQELNQKKDKKKRGEAQRAK